jgi:hypothetical protein
MDKDEKELLEQYRKLTPENKAIAQGNVHIVFATQENTLKEMRRNASKGNRKTA